MRKKSNKKTHEKIHEESLSNTDLNQSVSLSLDNQLEDSHPVLRVLSLEEILTIEVPERTFLLDPWLPSQGLVMIYAERGVGKTWFALWVAFAVASGTQFMGWDAPNPRGVLYIDGEMPLPLLKERIQILVDSNGFEQSVPIGFLTSDIQNSPIPDISTEEGKKQINALLDGVGLVVLDNLSTLVRSGRENEAEAWLPVQEWILYLRAKGKSVIFVHHAGKNGKQRGSSRREDVLDTVIFLKRPVNYNPSDGSHFEVHFEKARSVLGDAVKPTECRLFTGGVGHLEWSHKSLEASTHEKVLDMYNEGMSQKEIAEMLEINKATVSKHIKRGKRNGEVSKIEDI